MKFMCTRHSEDSFEFSTLSDLKRFLHEMEEHVKSECSKCDLSMVKVNCYFNPITNCGVVECYANTHREPFIQNMMFTTGMESCEFRFD